MTIDRKRFFLGPWHMDQFEREMTERMQHALNDVMPPEFVPLARDGIYGPKTMRAVAEIQARRRAIITGCADQGMLCFLGVVSDPGERNIYLEKAATLELWMQKTIKATNRRLGGIQVILLPLGIIGLVQLIVWASKAFG